ncbi:MAG TPA: hypothetical protein PLC80_14215, partial [Draconibacterium sp.]|nr:hypothetical protein [Draconibacterium sp.]
MKLKHILLSFLILFTAVCSQAQDKYPANYASAPRFKALIYYTTQAESGHVVFAQQTVAFFKKLTWGEGFILDVTTD